MGLISSPKAAASASAAASWAWRTWLVAAAVLMFEAWGPAVCGGGGGGGAARSAWGVDARNCGDS